MSDLAKLKFILPALALLLASLYGGFKGYIYYQVSSQLDNLIALAGPFAHITYDGISSSLDGRIMVEKIKVYPQGVSDEAAIDVIGLHGDGPLFLLNLLSGAQKGETPERLSFFVRGFKIGLGGEFAAQYTGLLQGFNNQTSRPYKECGFGSWVSPEAFRAIGMDAFVIDMDMGYRFNKDEGHLQANMEFGLQGVEKTALDIALSGVPHPGVMAMGAMPMLEDLSINYELNPDFAAKALSRCAGSRGQTVDAYIESLFANEEELAQALGFLPGPGISGALKHFLEQPGQITISSHPPADFDYARLGLYAPKDWAQLLSMELVVNDQPITDLSFTIPETASGSSLISLLPGMDQLPEEAASDAMGEKEKKARAKKRKLKFVVTPLRQLRNYIGNDVRLYTVNADAPREGRLHSVTEVEATVIQHVHHGKMSAHVPLSDITKVEVLKALE